MSNYEKILIVEDKLDIQMIAGIAFRDIGGKEVKFAEDGLQALELLEEWIPDVVMMDITMPNMSGPETAEKMSESEKFKDIPIIIMTAKSEDETQNEYQKFGVIEVMIKPFDPMILAKQVDITLGENKRIKSSKGLHNGN